MRKGLITVALIVGALALALTGGAALAQSNDSDSDSRKGKFAERVASILGLESSQVQDAMKQARTELRDEWLQEKLDAVPVRLVRRDAARGDVGTADEARLLQRGHLVAHGGGAERQTAASKQRLRAYGGSRCHVLPHDKLEEGLLARRQRGHGVSTPYLETSMGPSPMSTAPYPMFQRRWRAVTAPTRPPEVL